MDEQEKGWILGFDVGGTKTSVVAGTYQGRIETRRVFASDAERGFAAMWADMVRYGREVTAERGCPTAVSVSIGGPLESEAGIIHSPPHLPGWDAVPLKALLEEKFGVPAYIEHDARACAFAEWRFGAGRGKKTLLFLTFGTGLGAGMILDGRVYRGAGDMAGEVGHWRIADDGPPVYGKEGSWEGYASGAGIAALCQFLYPGRFPTGTSAADVIASARTGDVAALQVVEVAARYLGRGIAQLIDLLNPEMVVLGSLAVRAGDMILPIARRAAQIEALPGAYARCEIVPAALGDQIGDVAALSGALERVG